MLKIVINKAKFFYDKANCVFLDYFKWKTLKITTQY